jgi:hypothetical protein
VNEGAGQRIRQKASRARTTSLTALAAFTALVAMLLGGNARTVVAGPQAPVFNNPPSITLPAGCSAANLNVAEGDVTGDGIPDIVMFCPGGGGISPAIVTLPGNGDGTLSSPTSTALSTGFLYNGPVALADIDGDGKLDLVTEDLSCNIDVFLGTGGGTFNPTPVQIPEPDYCSSTYAPFLVADFNGDGRPDLVLEDNYGATLPVVTVFLNTSTAGSPSFSTNDVAVASSSSQTITGLAFGNFTGQSVPDLAVGLTTFSGGGTTNSMVIWKNLGGSGITFMPVEPALSLPYTTNTQSLGGIAAGDFNNDGKVDLAASDPGDGTIFVLYGDGAGKLSSCSPSGSVTMVGSCQTSAGQTLAGLTLPSFGGQLLSGKFNGQSGLLFSNANDGFSVFLAASSSGSPLQTTAQNYVVGPPSGGAITIDDLNGDGASDVILSANSGLSVLLNNGSGILEGTQAFPAQVSSGGAGPEEMGLLQNFFGNGEQDVVVGQNGDFSGLIDGNTITVLGEPSGAPNGTLPQSTGPVLVSTSPTAELTALSTGCLKNSNPCASPFVAFATQDSSTNSVAVSILQAGQTALSVILSFSPPTYRILSLGVGDFNGDGNADLALGLASGQIMVYTGNGTGSFTLATTLNFLLGVNDGPPEALAVAKFYGGSLPDIAVLDKDLGILGIFQNSSSTGSVSFQPALTYPVSGTQALGMAVGDFNNDTYPDIAVSYPGFVSVLLNQSGTLGSPSTFPVSGFSINGPIAVGDFNGDEDLDLALTVAGDSVLVLSGDGSGNFSSPPTAFIAGAGPSALAVADFNGDSKPDLGVADSTGNMVTVLLNGAANASVPTLQEIVITPTNPTIPVGGTVQLTVTGQYSDGSTQNLTDMVTWASDSSLVTVSPQGLATGVAPASLTNILATFGNFSAQIFITITPAPLPPTVTGVSPNSGPVSGGTPVTITGTNFSGATAVYFGLLSATPVNVVKSTQITVLSPSDSPGVVDVVVVTPGGASAVTPADEFTYYVPLMITTATLPNGVVGTSYSQTVTASQPATFAVTSGSLPPGLTLASGGTLSGTPTQAGSFTFTITAMGTVGGSAGQIYTVVILPSVTDNETISVNDTDTVNAFTLAAPIGVAAPVAYISAGSLGFSGQSGSQQTVAISNIGEASTSLTLASVAISPAGAPFTASSPSCFNGATSTTIPSGGFCTVTITYNGSSASDSGTLTFADNAALSNLTSTASGSNYMQSIPLSAQGPSKAPPGPPSATVPVGSSSSPLNEQINVQDQVTVTPLLTNFSPPAASFSTANLGFNSNTALAQTLTLSNVGGGPLTFSGPIGISPGFVITQTLCSTGDTSLPASLPSGGACTFTISYTGTSASGTVVFTDNAALSSPASTASGSNFTQTIALSGTGSGTGSLVPPSSTVTIPTITENISVTDTVSPPASTPLVVIVGSKVSSLILDPTTGIEQYVATVSLSNGGNVASGIQVTGATLNGASSPSVPIATSLGASGTANVTLKFPSGAGASGAHVLLIVKGTYTTVVVGGSTLSGSWTGEFRVVLPASSQ